MGNKYAEKYTEIVSIKTAKKMITLMIMFLSFAIFRYFYALDARMAFETDESVSFSRAVGYLMSGTFYEWDFFHSTLSAVYSPNHIGYTVFLAAWMKIFGVSLVSARSSSAVIGCLFIVSFVYISGRLFRRMDITILATSFVLLHPDITYQFRFIRYYALILFLTIWLIYFAYKAITSGNHFKRKNTLTSIINKHFDYNLKYCFLVVAIGYISTQIHNIQMVVFGGMLLFIIYKAITEKEPKYRYVSMGFLLVSCICLVFIWADWTIKIPVVSYFVNSIKWWFDFMAQNNREYYWDSVNSLSNQLLMYMGWFIAFLSLFKKSECKESRDKTLYLILIQMVSIIVFVWFANRYYQVRYLIFLLPISILVFSVGYIQILGKYAITDFIIVLILCGNLGHIATNSFPYLYTLYNAPGSQKVYEIVNRKYPGEKDILGIDHDMIAHGYFASELLDNVNFQYWENYDNGSAFQDVKEYAEKHPQGLIWVVKNQIFARSVDKKIFLINWLNRVAGEGLDNYNIEVSTLNYLMPEKVTNGSIDSPLSIKQEVQGYSILLDRDYFEPEALFVCISLIMEYPDGTYKVLRCQLDLPGKQDQKQELLEYTLGLNEYANVSLYDQYAVVFSDTLVERALE